MKLSTQDLMPLRLPLLVLLVCTILGIGVLLASRHYASLVVEESSRSDRGLNAARMQLSRSRTEDGNFRDYANTYNELATRGLFGAERRLDWIERVRVLSDRHHLFNVKYSIAPQKPMAVPANSPGERVLPFASKVRLDVEALHEEDLLGFLADVGREAPGVMLLRACSITRLPPVRDDAAGPNLRGDCEMDWITLKEKK